MNEKAMKTLEFNKIIQKLVELAISPLGKEEVSKLQPFNNINDITLAQKETSEAVSFILKKGSLPLGGIKDIREAIKRVSVGGVLSIEELVGIGDFLYVCQKVISYSRSDSKNDDFVILKNKFSLLVNCLNLKLELDRCITNSLEISDYATKELAEIRRDIKAANIKIKEQLNNIINSSKYKNMIQENVITIRNGRYCVPIKQEYQNSFEGMLHDQSSTGATVFIEPLVTVLLNNKIKELINNEKKEIDKILFKLSMLVAEASEIITSNLNIITELDCIFAKGEYSIAINGTEPVFNDKLEINIKKGRHPLLAPETVIPINIYLGKDFNMLLITGPNTGGKTVSLKTIGLFILMGQAGLHISADENSELAIFNDVFADIGDEQSIEQSLSTFSSHMTNIVHILEKAAHNSLVLLDELGAGTDPTEGAALAIAILQYLRDRDIRTVVTTHYSELKLYALSTDKVENASCEFNVETLKPTYNLLIGIPGKSNAFAISQKLGLPDFIIRGAKEILSHEDSRFEDIITDLEISKKSVMLEQEKAKEYRREAVKLKEELENKKQMFMNQREKIIMQAKDEARKILQDAKTEADILMKKFNKQLKESSSMHLLEQTRANIGNRLSLAEKEMGNMLYSNKVLEPITKKLEKGDKVFINSLDQSGTVITIPDNNGNLMVQAGALKVKMNIKNLSVDTNSEVKNNKPLHRYSNKSKSLKSKNISTEIDLRGCMTQEGIELADKYLDDVYIAGLTQVTIIHGKGTGALRSAVHNHLKNHPHVKSFRLGLFGEGENGVTIVTLN